MLTKREFFSAIESGQTDTVQALLSADPSLVNEKKDNSGKTAYDLAAERGKTAVAALLKAS